MLGELVPLAGGPPIPLLKPRLLLGRQDFCDIPIRFGNVSSRHCELELVDGYWHVQDLKSSNGTRVNGTPCTSEWLLPNDVLWLALHRYKVLYTPPPGRPPPRGPQPAVGVQAARAPVKPQSDVRKHGGSGSGLGSLIPCGGGDPVPLPKPALVVGRNLGCDVVLPFPDVSSRHCKLDMTSGWWVVTDLGSKNGVRVNGTRCQTQSLKPGSILALASHRYQVAYTPQGAGPPPEPEESLFSQSLLEKAGLERWQPKQPPAPKGKPGAANEASDEDDPTRKRYSLDDVD
jgi:adenylate cyclase